MAVTLADAPLVEPRPDEVRRTPSSPAWLPPLAWAALALAMALVALYYWNGPPYTVDSWSYYELSRHLGADFMRLHTYRSYQSPEPYSSSFGPMWPIVIHIVGAVTGTTVRAGYIAAFGCVAATAVVLEAYGRRVAALRGFGPLVALGLLAFPPYLGEVAGARSIPLALLLVAVLLWVLSGPGGGAPWRSAVAGALGAALVLTRSDTLLALVLLVGVPVVARRVSWRRAVLAGTTFVIVMLPWVYYSLVHFHTLLAGDNKLIASAVQSHFVTEVLDPSRVPTVGDDPWGWLLRVLGNIDPVGRAWWSALAPSVVAAAVVGAVWLLAVPKGRAPSWLTLPLLALACFTVQTAASQLTTGYLDQRYISGMVLLALVVAVGAIMSGEAPVRLDGRRAAVLAGVTLLVVPGFSVYAGAQATPPGPPDTVTGGVVEQTLRHCQRRNATLVSVDATAARHGALSNRMTGVIPANLATLSPAERRAWIEDYHIGYLYEPAGGPSTARRNADLHAELASVATLKPDRCARIGKFYRVSVKPAGGGR